MFRNLLNLLLHPSLFRQPLLQLRRVANRNRLRVLLDLGKQHRVNGGIDISPFVAQRRKFRRFDTIWILLLNAVEFSQCLTIFLDRFINLPVASQIGSLVNQQRGRFHQF